MLKKVESNIDFVAMEKKWLSHWYKNGIVHRYLSKNKNSDTYFSFLDGPITANNPMGVHHAWGRTYKDLWQKFHNLLGYKERFQNGFDCQGLWVEVEVEKELGLKTKKDIENLVPGDRKASIAKFVDLCKQRVIKYSGIQTEQTKRLGNFMDWDHSYFTMSDENNYMIWHFLKVCFENGWIYKGHESVPWCPRCETAISQHEMLTEDYKEVVHESVYLKLPIEGRKDEYLLVWTTTPWTIPANIAVAVHEKYEYSLVALKTGERVWILKELVDSVLGADKEKVVKTVVGTELVGLKYTGPFDDLPAVKKVKDANPKTFHIVVATDEKILPILKEEGTGLVHTAVSAGVEDFKLGKKLGLPMIPVIQDNAYYFEDLGFLSGKNAKKQPRLVLDFLEKEKWAYKIHNYKHRYPACWRCKTELVWKVADEWYIAMDQPSHKASAGKPVNSTLRERMMIVAKKISWMPAFGLDRELDWLKNMHDWLISKKNRYWGLALPIYECKSCGVFEVIGSKKELQERAVSGWESFEGHTPHKPFIDDVVITCSKCGKESQRIADVGNPWLDAGIVPYSTIAEQNQGEPLYLKNKNEWRNWFPVDFITESFPGQFKNWFYAMIAESTVLENEMPFKRVLGYGTLLGEDGRPMHKSWGNSIEFNEGADKIGVDVMRWMYVRQNPSENMLFGYKRADEVRRQYYLMLWNTYKFFVEYANLEAYDAKKNKDAYKNSKNVMDRWILSRLQGVIESTEKTMRAFNAKDTSETFEKFVSDVSTWYIRRSRDRLWVNSDNKEDKVGFYSTLHYVLENLSVMLSAFMPFISEEMYTNLTDNESVHLAFWPKADKKLVDLQLESQMAQARKLSELGHSLRKDLKLKIRQPLAAAAHTEELKVTDAEVLKQLLGELNLKEWVDEKKATTFAKKEGEKMTIWIDTALTDELKLEGEMRDLMRSIQEERKTKGAQPTDTIILTLPKQYEPVAKSIQKKVQAREIKFGDTLVVEV